MRNRSFYSINLTPTMFRLTILIFYITLFYPANQQFLRTAEGNFSETASSRFFIDKTLFIKYFITHAQNLVVLAPRGFGKSTNLSMMQQFLELQADRNGTSLPPNATQNYNLFKNLKIGREEEIFERHFAQHPVIYLNLKHLACASSYLIFSRSFRDMLVKMLLKHRYLLRSKTLNLKAPREFFNSFQMLLHPSFDPEKVIPMGRRMSRFLATHFDRKCVVLVDGFDAPGTQTLTLGGHQGFFGVTNDQRVLNIVGKFLSALLEGNDFVGHSLATGITRVGSTVVYANLTSVSVFENAEVGQFFGLTEPEVRDLAMRHARLDQVERLGLWYGGHHVEDSLQKLFNTRSVVSFFQTGKLKRVWETPPIMEQLSELFEYDAFGAFLEKSLETELPTALNKRYLKVNAVRFKTLLAKNYKHKPGDNDLLVQFLLENGYYTPTFVSAGVITGVAVPNLEMQEALQELLYTENFFRKKYDVGGNVVKNYVQALVEMGRNESGYNELLNSTLLIFEQILPRTEAEFQAPLFTFPTFVPSAFRDVTTTYTMDRRRRDVVLVRRKDGTRIILGVKFEESSEYEALKQVLANNFRNLGNVSVASAKNTGKLSKIEELRQKAANYKRLKDNSSAPSTILVGLHFNAGRECSLSYLCDSTNIMDANTLMVFY